MGWLSAPGRSVGAWCLACRAGQALGEHGREHRRGRREPERDVHTSQFCPCTSFRCRARSSRAAAIASGSSTALARVMTRCRAAHPRHPGTGVGIGADGVVGVHGGMYGAGGAPGGSAGAGTNRSDRGPAQWGSSTNGYNRYTSSGKARRSAAGSPSHSNLASKWAKLRDPDPRGPSPRPPNSCRYPIHGLHGGTTVASSAHEA